MLVTFVRETSSLCRTSHTGACDYGHIAQVVLVRIDGEGGGSRPQPYSCSSGFPHKLGLGWPLWSFMSRFSQFLHPNSSHDHLFYCTETQGEWRLSQLSLGHRLTGSDTQPHTHPVTPTCNFKSWLRAELPLSASVNEPRHF